MATVGTPFRYPYRWPDIGEQLWREVLDGVGVIDLQSNAGGPERDDILVDSRGLLDQLMSRYVDALATRLEDRDRALEDYLSTLTLTGGLRFATKVVAASNSLDAAANHADYICTGTNDQATINTAIAALPSTGGRVLLMDGTYNVDASVASISILKPAVRLEGQGPNTRIKQVAGKTLTGVGLIRVDQQTNLQVSRLQIDGNDSYSRSQTLDGILSTGCASLTVDAVTFSNLGRNGVLCDSSAVGGGAAANNTLITRCVFDHVGTVGNSGVFGGVVITDTVGGNTPHDILVEHCLFSTCHVAVFLAAGYDLLIDHCVATGGDVCYQVGSAFNGQPYSVTFDHCIARSSLGNGFSVSLPGSYTHLYNCQAVSCAGSGFELNGLTFSEILGCVAEQNNQNGFMFEGSAGNMTDCNIANCSAINNSQSPVHTYDGFIFNNLSSSVNDCFMHGCMARGLSHAYGIDIRNKTNTLTIVTNDFHASGTTGNFTDAGVGTIKNLDGSAANWNRTT